MRISGAVEPCLFEPRETPQGGAHPPPKQSAGAPQAAANPLSSSVLWRSNDDSAVRGIASLDNRLYVLHIRPNNQLDELDARDLRLQRRLEVPGDSYHLADMAACQRLRRLYISHETSNYVYVLALADGAVWTSWKIDGSPWGLSVTSKTNNLLVTLRYVNCVDEYSSGGKRLRRVELERSGVFSPWHAVLQPNSQPELLVVGHGDRGDDSIRVGFVRVLDSGGGATGQRWYTGPPGENPLSRPQHLAIGMNGTIAVVDVFNDRVVLLDDELRHVGVLKASNDDEAAGWRTSRVCWIGWRLCVAEVQTVQGKFTASRLTVYELRKTEDNCICGQD